jgi:hypothetical protein
VRHEIDGGRPLMRRLRRHMVVVKGYEVRGGQRLLVLNNPARQGNWSEPVEGIDLDDLVMYFLPAQPVARRQETTVTLDTDFDGVVDFDETERFHTDPHNRDSDGDGVPDKEDIASGVFETEHRYGYAFSPVPNSPGRDLDRDGLPTERDKDSDDGGCLDGIEDANSNGRHDGVETGNFDDADDKCGNIQGTISWTTVVTRDPPQRQLTSDTAVIKVSLKPEQPGRVGPLVDAGSHYRFQTSALLSIETGDPSCRMMGRQFVAGSGLFQGNGTRMGGYLSAEGLTIGAEVSDIEGRSTSDLCGRIGSGSVRSSMAMPDCLGRPDPRSPRTYVFDCTTPPDSIDPAVHVRQWSVKGTVTLR